MKRNSIIVLSLLFSVLFVSGCSNSLKQTQSGYLGDYTQLKPSAEYDDTLIYQAEGFDGKTLKQVSKIQLVPFEVWLTQKQSKSLNTEQVRLLVMSFHQKLLKKIPKQFKIVNSADSDTLVIKGAFTGVTLNDPEVSVGDFVPIKLVFNAGNTAYLNATGQKNVITEVSIEVEFLLGQSNERVFAMTATKVLDATVQKTGEDNVKAVESVLDLWIDNFVNKLEQVKKNNAI